MGEWVELKSNYVPIRRCKRTHEWINDRTANPAVRPWPNWPQRALEKGGSRGKLAGDKSTMKRWIHAAHSPWCTRMNSSVQCGPSGTLRAWKSSKSAVDPKTLRKTTNGRQATGHRVGRQTVPNASTLKKCSLKKCTFTWLEGCPASGFSTAMLICLIWTIWWMVCPWQAAKLNE